MFFHESVTKASVKRLISTSINQKPKKLMKTNNQLLVITHLSQLLDLVTLVGGFLAPLILWLANKDAIVNMDEQGRDIINFRLSMIIYSLLCIPLVLLFGLGLFGFAAIAVFYFIFPIINAIKVSNGEQPNYPFSLNIL